MSGTRTYYPFAARALAAEALHAWRATHDGGPRRGSRRGGLQAATRQTAAGEILGTLPCMSPEHVRGDPELVDHRADVYALGVLIYELLSGRRPHDVRSRSLPEVIRVVTHEEPTSLGRVDRRFRGDVETIVGKAMAKDPGRRYASAGELAADLRSYLADEPIAAPPASRLYQLEKFTRRRRALVAASGVTFAVLLAGTATSTVFYFQRGGSRSDLPLPRARSPPGASPNLPPLTAAS